MFTWTRCYCKLSGLIQKKHLLRILYSRSITSCIKQNFTFIFLSILIEGNTSKIHFPLVRRVITVHYNVQLTRLLQISNNWNTKYHKITKGLLWNWKHKDIYKLTFGKYLQCSNRQNISLVDTTNGKLSAD